MSIASEIQRLQTAKADIKTAIEAKGVTVPSSATIDTYDDYVSQISAGGSSADTAALKGIIDRSISAVTIPSDVTSIGNNAFRGCSNLTSIDIPNSVTSIGNDAFRGCSNLTSITIPNTVTTIESEAFYGCGLTSVTIPNNVTSIGGGTFNGCTSLTSCTIGGGVTSIGNNAFYNCFSLTSVDIPSGVTSIVGDAFAGCTSLTSITIEATVPPSLVGGSAFYNTNNCPIFVPSASVDTYKAASGWSTYADRIYAIPSWHQIATGESISESAYAIRVSTGVTGLNSGQNTTFGTTQNTYSILWENGNWYEWRVMTDGSYTPDSKTLLTAEDGYYTITIGTAEPFMGCDADEYGQGGVMYATFPFEIYY